KMATSNKKNLVFNDIGWWLVAGGWWLVAGGWWLVAHKLSLMLSAIKRYYLNFLPRRVPHEILWR
ncbi:MAG: hypothetical protein ABL915_04405, partial [Gallionella sp.]